MKKALSVILCLTMLLSMLGIIPFTASAAEADVAATSESGTTGDCTWSLNGTELTISGEGKMGDYDHYWGDPAPWGTEITKVTIENGVTSIGNYAFSDCTELTSVTIPNSVTSIGSSAFWNSTELTSITIPDSVTDMGDGTFFDCTGLTSVTIGNSVTSIRDWAFRGCTRLTSVTIPDSVTSIGEWAFFDCTGLTSITIPNSVTSIEYGAFEDCTGLKSVTIGNSVKSIGDRAFFDCTGLTSVTIGNSVNSIGNSAFEECSGLTSVTIPDSVTSIGEYAFKECSCLTSVTIGNSVTGIGCEAFWNCSGLKSVTIPGSVTSIGNEAFGYHKGEDHGSYYIVEKIDGFTIYGYTGTAAETYANDDDFTFVTIYPTEGETGDCKWSVDGTVLTISGNGKMNDYDKSGGPWTPDITEVIIEDGVTNIGDFAFNWCEALTSVTIGSSVTKIGDYAFHWCEALTSVTIPDSVTNIGDDAFYGCTGLTSVTIPDSVTNIGDDAFYGCTGLTSVTIGNSVKSIGDRAFFDCTGLTSVTIPDSVTSIGESAFEECTGLTSITIGNSVTKIGDHAFFWCVGLTSVTIPDSVNRIGSGAFGGCKVLTSITVDSANTKYDSRNNCNAIIESGSNTLICGCRNTVIPNSVTSIGNHAFYGCTGLTSVTIPDSVTNIEEGAFEFCSGLSSVTIPDSVTRIDPHAFSGCTSLKSITIPATVTLIDTFAIGWTRYYSGFVPIKGFTICGYSGSAAENYAKKYDFTFVALDKPALLAAPKVTKVQNTAAGVSVTYGKVTGAAKYRIFRKAGSGSFAKLADTTALTYVDKTAKSGTKYAYTVRCISKDGKSYTSNYDKTGKSILCLAQPKITKFENVANGIKLTLSKTTGAASYKVFIKSGKAWKQLATVKTNTYTYAKAKSGTTYTFTVRAVSKDGKTLSSYNTTGWKQKFVAAPALPTLKNTKSGVQITIKKVVGAEKYRIFRKEGNGKWAKLTDTTKLTYVDKKAKNGKTYSYNVRCISKDGKAYTSAYNTTGKSIKCKR